jgi:predicted alpha/beta-fold hydrolase
MRHRLLAERIDLSGVDRIRTIYELDDRITGPSFGFQGAEHYYRTQSAQQFLARIRVPTLLVQAQDDPLIPFEVYRQAGCEANSSLTLMAPEHGGHVGFLSRGRPRLWVDEVLCAWMDSLGNIS